MLTDFRLLHCTFKCNSTASTLEKSGQNNLQLSNRQRRVFESFLWGKTQQSNEVLLTDIKDPMFKKKSVKTTEEIKLLGKNKYKWVDAHSNSFSSELIHYVFSLKCKIKKWKRESPLHISASSWTELSSYPTVRQFVTFLRHNALTE